MKKFFVLAVCMLFMLPGLAKADYSANLYLGGNYTHDILMDVNGVATNEGGGSIYISTLNGNTLPWVYCVDLYHTVYVPGTYNATNVSSAANIVNGMGSVNDAGQVAWLLTNYAGKSGTDQGALQAAIWHVIYGSTVVLDPSSSLYGDYTAYLNALGTNTATVSNFLWLTPGVDGSTVSYSQGLVTVPIPAAVWLLGSGLVGLVAIRRRFRFSN